MAEKDIIQNMISRLGQSQKDRFAKELDVHFADVDERTSGELLQFVTKLSKLVNYYGKNASAPSGDWTGFVTGDIDPEKLIESAQGETKPHLALLLSFLKLYGKPRK
jgi:hypothetical protein